MIHVTDRFDAGNVVVVDASSADDLRLAIRADAGGEHYQWFHFRVSGARGQRLRWRIANAGGASYPAGWSGYRACASYDRRTWFRVDTAYDDGELIASHDVAHDTIWYAYFAPYPWERHQQLLGRMQAHARLEVLGDTLDGHSLDLLTLGEGPRPLWIIGRQHPGETMAEWLIEGLLERLADPSDALARRLLTEATFHVVPNMNPDGSRRGHLRTNAAGRNLNRVWHAPQMATEPEVALVKARMERTGVALCLDVHGDEALPYNFIAGPDGVAGLDPKVLALRDEYAAALARACPAFQTAHGYPRARPGEANLTMCTNQVAHRFGALAMTLEQPFKDDANAPMPEEGWSPRRCKALGRAQLDAIAAVLPELAAPTRSPRRDA